MSESSTAADLLHRITESAGSTYINRAHQRSFSLNVFQMNAVELIEASQRVKDPDQGFALMLEKNREAGRQAHRELSRHVHNFVSSALTLVEHTRVFMRKHYVGTELLTAYEKLVAATFLQSPVAQFVQGLRNYMLHRGLPNSSMFMNFKVDPSAKDGSGTMETGVHYDTASLLDWKDWKPSARKYLEGAGKHLDLHEFVQEYLTLVNQFHGWLDATLERHHRSDLEELERLQAELQAVSPVSPPTLHVPSENTDVPTVGAYEFSSKQSAELTRMAGDLLTKVRELKLQQTPQGFQTDRPTTSITDQDIIGPITFWGHEPSGEPTFMFIYHESKSFGFSESDHRGLEALTEVALKLPWARAGLSRGFVEKVFIDWARQRFVGNGPSFAEALSSAARDKVKALKIWAPIANMEIEESFEFGPVRIEPVTSAVIDGFRSTAPDPRPEQEEQVAQLFEKLRQDIQGRAAVVVSMEAEPGLAEERGLQVAQDVVGLLRFFSPAGPMSFLFSPIALSGAEYIPRSNLIVLQDAAFSLTQRTLPQKIGFWRLSRAQIAELKSGLLDIAGSLVMPDGLDDFALAVRESILIYSKGTTLVDPMDRLRNCITALESVFLRHEMEPRQHSIANRLSALLAHARAERDASRQTIQQIYWMQSQPQLRVHGPREEELIALFTSYAYDALRLALSNVPRFESKVEFVIEVDRLAVSSK